MDQKALLLGLMVTGTSLERSGKYWRACIIPYTVALFKKILDTIPDERFTLRHVRGAEIRPQLDLLEDCIKLAERMTASADMEIINLLPPGFKLHSSLPVDGDFTGCGLVGLETQFKFFYCHYALVLSGLAELSAVPCTSINEARSDFPFLRAACFKAGSISSIALLVV